MFLLFQRLPKVLRAKMADPRGPLLPRLLWWRGGLWTADTQLHIVTDAKQENHITASGWDLFHSDSWPRCLNITLNWVRLAFRNLQNAGIGGSRHKSVLLDCIAHLCMNSMILSLLRSCGSVYFSSPFSKYFRLGKPEILKRSPTPLCTVASTAASTPGLWRNNKPQIILANYSAHLRPLRRSHYRTQGASRSTFAQELTLWLWDRRHSESKGRFSRAFPWMGVSAHHRGWQSGREERVKPQPTKEKWWESRLMDATTQGVSHERPAFRTTEGIIMIIMSC